MIASGSHGLISTWDTPQEFARLRASRSMKVAV
jgi:hypothetical protein